jgi:hypothetical protein
MLHVSHASMLPQNVEGASPVEGASLRYSPVERHGLLRAVETRMTTLPGPISARPAYRYVYA